MKFTLVRNLLPLYGTLYTTCIGCDTTFNEILNIKQDCIRQTERANIVHNNIRNTSSFTSTSSTSQSYISQQQSVSNNIRSVQSNNNVDSIGTFDINGRQTQNSFNVSQPNRPNVVRGSTTISNNRENSTSWINTHNFNSLSDQSTPRNARNIDNKTSVWDNIDNNAEIMCNCHEIAIQLTVKKEGPNKGK